jgi:outer membrane lipoprotein carrier protein
MRKLILVLVFGLWGVGHATPLEEIVARLEQAEKEVQSLQFDFVQTTTLSLGGKASESRGTATFQRPNRFRVELSVPGTQTYISNGKQFWVYLPDRGQALKGAMDNWARFNGFPQGLTPFQMNMGEMKKKYDFTLAEEKEGPVLTLSPKAAGSTPYRLRLWVDMATGVARQTALVSENLTAVVRVQNVKVNPRVTSSLFRFTPPKGIDVLEMPLK